MKATERFDSLWKFYGEEYSVPWQVLKAQALAESGLDPMAVSPVGARGLSQFMSRTWAEWADGTPGIQELPTEDLVFLNPENPEAAIRAQAAYMAWLLKHAGGGTDRALAAYNWGVGRVRRLAGADWRDQLPPETRTYLERIHRYLNELGATVEV